MKRKGYSSASALLLLHVKAHALPTPELEFRFHPTRRWRFDFAWPDEMVAVEIHGAVFQLGRHTRGEGFTNDRRKINAASEIGWSVYEFTSEMVSSGEAVQLIERVLWGEQSSLTAMPAAE